MLRRLAVLFLLGTSAACAAAASGPIPAPAVDESLAKAPGQRVAVVAGGCFWGIQAVYQHVKGVTSAVSGYAGGTADTAHYDIVGTGQTGHAESEQITYDTSQITYGRLLQVFFSVSHDPTTLNRQGPDEGTQYRSVIFYGDADQQRIAEAYIAQLNDARAFGKPIVTTVVPLNGFYQAEDYHQDYATNHPYDMYIMVNDAPKVTNLKKLFPDLYR